MSEEDGGTHKEMFIPFNKNTPRKTKNSFQLYWNFLWYLLSLGLHMIQLPRPWVEHAFPLIKVNKFVLLIHSFACVFAAGAGKRNDTSEEAAGGAWSHEVALPSNRAERSGPAGQTGAGRHQKRTQQVMMMMMMMSDNYFLQMLHNFQTLFKI